MIKARIKRGINLSLCFIFFIINFLSNFVAYSQIILGEVIDANSHEKVIHASLYNKNNNKFTFSGINGQFNLNAIDGDTIEIRHISYETKVINLNPKTNTLDEVVVSAKIIKKDNSKYLGYNIRDGLYGLAMQQDNATLIRNNFHKKLKLERIILPIKFKKYYGLYSSEGSFVLQLFKTTEEGLVSNIPISKLYSIPIESIKKSKKIIIEIQETIVLPESDFFVVFKRIVPNKVFESRSKTLSVNPFLYVSEDGKEGDTFMKLIYGKDEWIMIKKEFYGKIFKYNIQLYVTEIE